MKDTTKLVLFDWGGVVDNTDFEHSYNYKQMMIDALRHCYHFSIEDYSDDELWEIMENANFHQLCHDGNNEVTFRDMLTEKCMEMFPVHQPPHGRNDEYISYIMSHHKYIPYYKDIVEFEYSVADKCLIGIMSDLNWHDGFRIREQMDLYKFDYAFLSYACGASKRVGDLYRYVENETGIHGDRILLIDDRQVNLDNAKKLNWQTYKCGEHDLIGITGAVSSFLCYS